tara:strand:+ start:403 stop:861 length:459 start_codon:yes stop_codon:yes gene_type:complete
MPDPVFIQADKAIAAAIAANYAAGYSGLDLSATGSVVRGIIPDAPVLPFASLFLIDVVESQGPTLGRYQGTMTFEIYAFCAGDSITERTDKAGQLAADIIKSITIDRSLGLSGAIDDVLCSFRALEGDKIGIPRSGCAFVQCAVTFQSQYGV